MKKFQPALWNENKTTRQELCVGAKGAQLRLDKFISRYLNDFSRHEVQKLIWAGRVTVNGNIKKPAFQLRYGDLIIISRPEKIPFQNTPTPLALSVLYDDEWLVAVNKPPGMLMHPVFGNLTHTVMNALAFHYQKKYPPPQPVHRLDKDVSGVVLASKDKWTSRQMSTMFSERRVQKTYLALLEGMLHPASGTIDQPIKIFKKGRTCLKSARTQFRILKNFQNLTLAIFQPFTGRWHQIRQHAQSMGCPIVGDKRYGCRSDHFHRPALHASKIVFLHPILKDMKSIVAPLPEDFRLILTELNRQTKIMKKTRGDIHENTVITRSKNRN
ncbi:RluA family pseudouridine synthase [candidate division CSSED10-310 bacterium]|uniref:Pseudouridine synthase n=1 Tax=candidate division CSSED10-310 bacterium TaxID=2855610 RepID=A0ABV6YUP5_UNCC1